MLLKIIIPFFILFLSLFSVIHAQQDLPQVDIQTQIINAENDYRHQFDLYRNAYTEYTRTKAVWKSSGTLKAEQEALNAGKAAALARNNVMTAYTFWIRLQLLQFASTYDKVIPLAERLLNEVAWYEQHQVKINNASSIETFDQVMAEYSEPLAVQRRDNLYSLAQLELKLAHLAFYQHQARALYDPILKILETKTEIPEITQGFVRINQLTDSINTELVSLSNVGGSIEAESFNQRQFHRLVNERLSALHSNQVNLLEYIIELEARYAR